MRPSSCGVNTRCLRRDPPMSPCRCRFVSLSHFEVRDARRSVTRQWRPRHGPAAPGQVHLSQDLAYPGVTSRPPRIKSLATSPPRPNGPRARLAPRFPPAPASRLPLLSCLPLLSRPPRLPLLSRLPPPPRTRTGHRPRHNSNDGPSLLSQRPQRTIVAVRSAAGTAPLPGALRHKIIEGTPPGRRPAFSQPHRRPSHPSGRTRANSRHPGTLVHSSRTTAKHQLEGAPALGMLSAGLAQWSRRPGVSVEPPAGRLSGATAERPPRRRCPGAGCPG